jgi:hypothetical protein
MIRLKQIKISLEYSTWGRMGVQDKEAKPHSNQPTTLLNTSNKNPFTPIYILFYFLNDFFCKLVKYVQN